MIRVACPRCHAVISGPDHAAGRVVPCPKCRAPFQIQAPNSAVPIVSSTPDPETFDFSQDNEDVVKSVDWLQRHRRARLRRRIALGFLLMVALAAGLVYLMRPHGPLAGKPATCREFVERLQTRGMDVDWQTRSANSVWLIRRGSPADNARYILNDSRYAPHFQGWVVIQQWETEKQAMEAAGSIKHSFAYGRFLVYGDEQLVREVQGKI